VRTLVKAPLVRPGDTIGVITPAWCGPALFPHRLARGVSFLEGAGFPVALAPHATGRNGDLAGTPAERAADIHALFADPAIRAICTTIGGDHSCHLLPLLDWALIRAHPKVFLGYSDITVLNVAMYARAGLVTFNGPGLMTDLAEFPAPFPYTLDHLRRAVTTAAPIGAIRPAPAWTEEFLDWGTRADLARPRVRRPSPGWTWLKGGRASGPLLGGCLESLQHLRGTPYWPDLAGALLFLETGEARSTPAWVDAVLQDYENMGVFADLGGLLIGRPVGYTAAQRVALRAVVLERTRRYAFPIVSDMDFGHTVPQVTLPLGCRAVLDSATHTFAITEAAVVARA
jgi:muramoyltetrapeptide carboxypeptidase